MADRSKIEWTDATWNPLRGCSRVSEGCRHCYAEKVAMRFSGPGKAYEGLIHRSTGAWSGKVRLMPEKLREPWDWVKSKRIFVNSMSDLFHESVPFEFIAAVLWIMSVTTRHTYQVLTKRPARMLEFFQWVKDYDEGFFEDDRISDVGREQPGVVDLEWEPSNGRRGGYDNCGPAFPYENVWLGVSVEDQKAVDERIPLLLQCPAAVRWLSCEPLLGPIDLTRVQAIPHNAPWNALSPNGCSQHAPGYCLGGCEWRWLPIDWVVAGGESGPGARPMHPDWARSLRDQCASAGVPFFFKQWGEWAPADDINAYGHARHGYWEDDPSDGGVRRHDWKDNQFPSLCTESFRVGKRAAGRLLDGVEHNEFPEQQT
ncbi:MAG TPA: phage Gp37/Gp68 family protein [Dyella sp.]|uniref:DUF5131 family protein n=1 Tax=Dyella sp. TaxID=1869338 RepID=UPI002C786915|nr:phage Gp37/Gp68 family protein [Dyella sp.]HUB88615.1 phage Gp37/Gp68 family protein [Dyella sp.]